MNRHSGAVASNNVGFLPRVAPLRWRPRRRISRAADSPSCHGRKRTINGRPGKQGALRVSPGYSCVALASPSSATRRHQTPPPNAPAHARLRLVTRFLPSRLPWVQPAEGSVPGTRGRLGAACRYRRRFETGRSRGVTGLVQAFGSGSCSSRSRIRRRARPAAAGAFGQPVRISSRSLVMDASGSSGLQGLASCSAWRAWKPAGRS